MSERRLVQELVRLERVGGLVPAGIDCVGGKMLQYDKEYSREWCRDRVAGRRLFRELWRRSRSHVASGRLPIAVFSHDFIAHHINIDGVYERVELETVAEWLSTLDVDWGGGAFVDVGANIGNHALFFASRFKSVHCFEANPSAFALLQLNTVSVGNIRCKNVGVSDRQGVGRMMVPVGNIGHGHLIAGAGSAESVEIPLETLDDILDCGESVRLMKIDVEGHEAHVITGAAARMRRDKPIVMFEQLQSEFVGGTSESLDLLREIGYRRFATVELRSRGLRSTRPAVDRVCRVLNRLIPCKSRIFGQVCEIRMQRSFGRRDYPCILALPDWIE